MRSVVTSKNESWCRLIWATLYIEAHAPLGLHDLLSDGKVNNKEVLASN